MQTHITLLEVLPGKAQAILLPQTRRARAVLSDASPSAAVARSSAKTVIRGHVREAMDAEDAVRVPVAVRGKRTGWLCGSAVTVAVAAFLGPAACTGAPRCGSE